MSSFNVVISPTAFDMLETVKDRRIRRKLAERIDGLTYGPEKEGKALSGDLAGLRSVRAVGPETRVVGQPIGCLFPETDS